MTDEEWLRKFCDEGRMFGGQENIEDAGQTQHATVSINRVTITTGGSCKGNPGRGWMGMWSALQ